MLYPMKYATLFDEESNGGVAKWRESEETWFIPRLDLVGTKIKPILRISEDSIRPESEYTKKMRQRDPTNMRWRQKNVINLSLDAVGKVSQTFDSSSKSNVNRILNLDIDDNNENQTNVHVGIVPGNPYLRYTEVSIVVGL